MQSIAACSASLAALFIFSTALPAEAAGHGPERPNILWITCQDISPNLGCYGDSYARTPVLDGLASPNVRIAAAEALANVGRVEDAMPALIAGLGHETPFIRLRAMNVLDRLGIKARPALAAMKEARLEAKSHVGDYLGRMVEYVPEKFGGAEK
ncbi:MAG: HEAT repeat domain-containing protein [Planctomycetota bacterium]